MESGMTDVTALPEFRFAASGLRWPNFTACLGVGIVSKSSSIKPPIKKRSGH